jgi:hypothetical protein
VPLSENERRRLEQMEQALAAEDPRFASSMRWRRAGSTPRLVIGIAALVVGLVMLVVAVAASSIIVGAAGFVVMLAGTAYAISGARQRTPVGVLHGDGTLRGGTKRRGSFMQRLERRWDQRRGGR